MTSLLTNNAAKVALQTLTMTMKNLDTTQNRIATGLRVADASDNAAYWAIATTMRADSSSLSTVSDALNLGASTIDTASNGLNKSIEVVKQLRDKLVSAATPGIDRGKVQDEISQLQSQLRSIADSASFNGQNWLSIDSGAAGFNATKSIVSSFSRDTTGAVTIGTINVDTRDVALFDKSSNVLTPSSAITPATNGGAGTNTTYSATDATFATSTGTFDNDIRTGAATSQGYRFTVDFSQFQAAGGTYSYAAVASSATTAGDQELGAGDEVGVSLTYNAQDNIVTVQSIQYDAYASGTASGPRYIYSSWQVQVTGDRLQASSGGILDKADTSTVGTYTDASGVTTSTASNGTGESILSLDISSLTNSAEDLALLNAYTKQADQAISALTQAGSNLGSAKTRITTQQSFISELKNSIDKGIGSLVDADMNEESTRLQALQVQQQLGVQALSIANQTSQTILSLFR
jgi:flagellin